MTCLPGHPDVGASGRIPWEQQNSKETHIHLFTARCINRNKQEKICFANVF